jgi:hypothetical protein
VSQKRTWPRFRISTYVFAAIFALSTALLVGALTARRPVEPVTPGEPPPSWERYILQPGDTLRKLARSRDVPLKSVLRANGLDNSDVSAGQEVYLPSMSTAEAGSTPSLFDSNTLTAAGAFVTSVGSLVGVVLTYMRSRREMELADRRHAREVELERHKLELERLRMEQQGGAEDDNHVRPSVE